MAKRDIEVGDEIFFNYGENYNLDWTRLDNHVSNVLLEYKKAKGKRGGKKLKRIK